MLDGVTLARTRSVRPRAKPVVPFNAQAFLDTPGLSKTIVEYSRGETIFTQGDVCIDVLYIQTGGVKLSVLSKNGREAVVAMLGPGDFFGEGCLAGQPVRMGSAMARKRRAFRLRSRISSKSSSVWMPWA